jgi:hypothetical protein
LFSIILLIISSDLGYLSSSGFVAVAITKSKASRFSGH